MLLWELRILRFCKNKQENHCGSPAYIFVFGLTQHQSELRQVYKSENPVILFLIIYLMPIPARITSSRNSVAILFRIRFFVLMVLSSRKSIFVRFSNGRSDRTFSVLQPPAGFQTPVDERHIFLMNDIKPCNRQENLL